MADCKPKIKAVANISKNRLYVTIAGNITLKLLEKLYTDIRFCVADLKPGFNVISDISQCNIIYVVSFPVYKKIIQYLVDNRIGSIVRIIKKDTVGCKQVERFTESMQCYKIMYAYSLDEAENLIENSILRDGIRVKLIGKYIEYRKNNECGKGLVTDISISGCAVQSWTVPVSKSENISITIYFEEHDSIISEFITTAMVTRANHETFAVQFLDLNDERKEQLYKRLTYEIGRVACSS
ncbi:MAG: PilZ domain-containing protein [Desulfobulbus sp.]|nr:PilZ domain-containing protein [Desulfobulbus sp.]